MGIGPKSEITRDVFVAQPELISACCQGSEAVRPHETSRRAVVKQLLNAYVVSGQNNLFCARIPDAHDPITDELHKGICSPSVERGGNDRHITVIRIHRVSKVMK